MSKFAEIFGKRRRAVWQEVSEEMGFQFIEGSMFKTDKIIGTLLNWNITLDTYTVSTGKSSTTYTRLRAPYRSMNDFRFKVYRKGIFSEIRKLFGTQDVEIGIPRLDENFIIQANDAKLIKTLLSHESIQKIIEDQERITLEVKDNDGWMGTKFPDGVKQLYFQDHGVIKDEKRLIALFFLFAEVLKKLHEMEIADYLKEPIVYK